MNGGFMTEGLLDSTDSLNKKTNHINSRQWEPFYALGSVDFVGLKHTVAVLVLARRESHAGSELELKGRWKILKTVKFSYMLGWKNLKCYSPAWAEAWRSAPLPLPWSPLVPQSARLESIKNSSTFESSTWRFQQFIFRERGRKSTWSMNPTQSNYPAV